MEKLFAEFNGVSSQQWKDQIVKDLKGIDFNALKWNTRNGITVNPFYTAEDQTNLPEPIAYTSDWDVCETVVVKDEAAANKKALEALKRGASGLVFIVDRKIDTKKLLAGISLDHIYSQFILSNDSLHVLKDLSEHYGKINVYDGKVKCFVNIDPLYLLTKYGEWHEDEENDMKSVLGLKHLHVNSNLYQEAGANQVNELAFTLAHLNEYYTFLNNKGSLSDRDVVINISLGSDFFNEIAKVRALRLLTALLQEQYGIKGTIHIHGQTTQLNKSEKDAYNNMLRSTTEAMSGIIGGCNSFSVLPYDEGFGDTNEFSARISLNQQHILRDESYLNKVADISAGSYYIENLTHALSEKAWEQFKAIEKQGGYLACIKNGIIQKMIQEDLCSLIEDYKENKQILIGVNKFPNPKDADLNSQKIHMNTKGKTVERLVPRKISNELL